MSINIYIKLQTPSIRLLSVVLEVATWRTPLSEAHTLNYLLWQTSVYFLLASIFYFLIDLHCQFCHVMAQMASLPIFSCLGTDGNPCSTLGSELSTTPFSGWVSLQFSLYLLSLMAFSSNWKVVTW